MSMKTEIERYKVLNSEVRQIKERIKALAESLGITVNYGVDTIDTLLTKIEQAVIVTSNI